MTVQRTIPRRLQILWNHPRNVVRNIWLGIAESGTDFTTSSMWDVPEYEYTRRFVRWMRGIR